MNNVLFAICSEYLNIMNDGLPTSSTWIAKQLGISTYQVRKELKKLREVGLVVSTIYREKYEQDNCIIRGYTITEKAKSTTEYKVAYIEEGKIRSAYFGIGMSKDEMPVFEE